MEKIKKKWSKKEVRIFISRYRSHRLLWDSKAINYRNKIAKRTQFFYEHKKEMKDGNSLDSKSAYISKWENYRALKFLLCEEGSDGDNSLLSDDQDEMCDNQDEYQMFGNYVASELRSMHFEKNIIELKRLIQQHIIQLTEEDDKEYYSI